jgi:hypothetical protein
MTNSLSSEDLLDLEDLLKNLDLENLDISQEPLIENNPIDLSSIFSEIDDISPLVQREDPESQQLDSSISQNTSSDTDLEDDLEPFPVSNDLDEALPEGAIDNNNANPGSTLNPTNFDLNKVFKLHSNPNAKHTVYLDFDGATVTNTLWNNSTTPQIVAQAFDTDGNAGSFSTTELQTIVGIWQQVAEDFAPFEVNVTTEAPPPDDLKKSGTGDTRWGVQTLMTQNLNTANNARIASSDGGIAYVGNFGDAAGTPAFVFNKGELNAAATASHEVGHTLGLEHDGLNDSNPNDATNDAKTYYSGYGSGATSWGPLMGAPFGKSLTQWDRGEYSRADNQEDDLSIITTKNGFGYKADDYGDTLTNSSRLAGDSSNKISAFGTIERNTDQDTFSFKTGAGNVSLNFGAASRSYLSDGNGNYDLQYLDPRGSNLDMLINIFDANGTPIAQSNPSDATAGSLNLNLSAGTYYLEISGIGKSGPEGYSDYGSLGQYAISGILNPIF